ncbi:glycoside hydrolase family 92 protein [Xylariomycetidae sp. FL0641]|nr:glycoside hydrolase family 92 protein [Xylariomycetidae sp. FL0641]
MSSMWASFPRRRRGLLFIPLLALFVWALLPIGRFDGPRNFLQTLTRSPWTSSDDILRYIDPLIGTTNGGHVFPGASLPYGMAKPVADVNNYGEIAAGFVSDNSQVQGFSHLHDSGTGGSPSLGNFPLFAHPGCLDDDYSKCKFTSYQRATPRINDSATARVGYFSIGLNNSVYAEMTAAEHTTLLRFNFSEEPEVYSYSQGGMVPNRPLILLDLIDLGNTRKGGSIQIDPVSGRMTGNGTFQPSFGTGKFEAHFCADFTGADIRKTGTFMDQNSTEVNQTLGNAANGFRIPSGSAGAFIHFARPPTGSIMARVGLSFISVNQACENAETEIPDFDFGKVVHASEEAWVEKLSVIKPDQRGMSEDFLKTFWSGLYRTMLSPQDYTGENQLWDSDEPYFDSFYCIWDSFRAQHPLLTIIDPAAQTRMVRSLIDIYKHEGKLPDCRMSFSKGYTQGGSNADVVLADAYLKNLTDGIDWALGYEAVVSDAEVEPKNWAISGRGGLESWHNLGYIPYDDDDKNGTGPMSRSVSRTMEYAYDDFAIAMMARGMGRTADESKYLQRSRNWRHLFNAEQEDWIGDGTNDDREPSGEKTGFTGFAQPRYRNGTWHYQSTRLCSPIHEPHLCYFDTQYATYEGSPWLYTLYVPQDMAGLAAAAGGRPALAERLDYFHASGLAYLGNEPDFLPVFQFHYAGRPGRSSYWLHRYVPAQFNASVNGIPGNDDCAMGAFAAFAFLGFFPVAGQDVYLLTPPLFPDVAIRTPDGRGWATLRNVRGFDPSYKAIYIQSATLNGEPYSRNWITHDFFTQGGTLEFVLGTEESDWGTREEDLPPSLSTGL